MYCLEGIGKRIHFAHNFSPFKDQYHLIIYIHTMESPSQQASVKPARNLFHSVMKRLGSKNSVGENSSVHSTSPITVNKHSLNNDEDDIVDEEVYNVTTNDDMFAIERNRPFSKRIPLTMTDMEGSKTSSMTAIEGDDEDGGELLTFEEMLHLQMHRQHKVEDDVAAPLSPSISNSSRRLIKSLPRVFRSVNQRTAESHDESKTDDEHLSSRSDRSSTDETAANIPRPVSLSNPNVSAVTEETHRAMLREFQKRFRSSKERLLKIDMTEEMQLVEAGMLDKKCKSKLTDGLIAVKEDFLVKVHFCCAVAEYERMPDNNSKPKRSKGTKIVRMFISKDSMFHLTGIPQSYVLIISPKNQI